MNTAEKIAALLPERYDKETVAPLIEAIAEVMDGLVCPLEDSIRKLEDDLQELDRTTKNEIDIIRHNMR